MSARMRQHSRRWLWPLLALLLAFPVWAHKASDSLLALTVDATDPRRIDGQWDIALRDLDFLLGLDSNDDGAITWGELRVRQSDIASHALARLTLASAQQPCTADVRDMLVDQHSDGAYAVLRFAAHCPQPVSTLAIDYRLLFDQDRQHKGLLRLEGLGRATISAVFAAEQTSRQFAALAEESRWQVFGEFVGQGILHIWIGIDHILFLLSLLLPGVLVWRQRTWQPADGLRAASWEVLKIVTAFTVAHSLTLSAATLGWLALPSRVVESVIALSVVLAALNNLSPRLARGRWTMAFAFGLIHGFGFASVLADLGLPESALLVALLAFNAGVEIGQLAIVAAFLPLAYALRKTFFYRRIVLQGGSLTITAIALLWFVERAFDLKFMPF